MAYNAKTNWQLNETVMPADMNRIEQGIKDADTNKRDKTDVIPLDKGGTGQTSAAAALAALFGISSNASQVLANGNLNNCTSIGLYMYNHTDASTIQNVPEITQGTVLVLPRVQNYASSPVNLTQLCFTQPSRVYIRTMADNIWLPWSELYGPNSSAVPTTKGGTGATTAAAARTNLDAQQRTNSLTALSAIVDTDTFPVYDVSVTGDRKMTWLQLKTWLKTYFDSIYAANNTALTSEAYIYVSTSGNDSTGNGTAARPYRTINYALSKIPKNLNGFDATIHIYGGNYGEAVVVGGFTGTITFTTATSPVTLRSLVIDGCTISITGQQVNFANQSTDTAITLRSGAVLLSNVAIYIDGARLGVSCQSNSSMNVFSTITLNGVGSGAVEAYGGANFYAATIAGNSNANGVSASNGGVVSYGSMTLVSITKHATSTGGRIYTGAQASVPNY